MTARDSRAAVIVIPAYEPTETLTELVTELSGDGRAIVVVNDGSSAACADVFARVDTLSNVTVLAHAVNLGKGQALKTAFNHVLLHSPAATVGVVTADADGQHLAPDIRRVAERLERDPSDNTLILGSRGFSGTVPLRSRFGNVMTRGVFRLLVGRALTDTQTGLRGIPRAFLGELLQVEAGRYEFELEMLMRATAGGIGIEELPIATVYGSFAKSHFNPLRDSLRIYFVFLRFVGLSIVTAGLDYATFAVVYGAQHNILLATVIARAIAGLFNFTANRAVVFQSRGNAVYEALKYATLVVVLMSISYGLLTTLVIVLGLGVYVSKLLAEGALFAASFALQNLVVFAGRRQSTAADARATDWDAYYEHAGVFTPLTRRITTRLVMREIKDATAGRAIAHVVELGGGNSALLSAIRAEYPGAQITAIDSNARGLQLLTTRFPGDARVRAVQGDVLEPIRDPLGADVVFSVGLIEHFDAAGTARAIGAHFDHAGPGAIVVITYPTPTWLYRLVRGGAELIGIWEFPDERPLSSSEVTTETARHGQIVRTFINWPIVLTQGIVVARKHSN